MLLMMSLMTGGAFFRVLYQYTGNNSFTVSKITALFSLAGLILIFKAESYELVTIGYILYEFSVGMVYPIYSKIKSEYLPSEKRGTLMNLFKIPFNVTVIFLLVNTSKILSLSTFWLLSISATVVIGFLQAVFFTEERRQVRLMELKLERETKEEENGKEKEKKNTKNKENTKKKID